MNRYVYCRNNPIKYIDPSGEFALTAGLAASASWWAPYVVKGIIAVGSIGATIYYAKKSKSSQKERATNVPSWAKGKKPKKGESGNDFAKRLMDEKYGKDNYNKGPSSEYNKLKKYGDRGAW